MTNRVVTLVSLALLTAGPALGQRADSTAGRGTPTPPGTLNDRDVFMNAARTAWTYVDAQYNAQTGLVNSVSNYRYATVWDIGSGVLALYSANQLGLLPDADYDTR
ncbi:MAG: DUF3131 domain-containing protein, partial [Gemmatimonadetes bacterium]|nr:DUF3131 domain-containing protein [Gemmatimonadota bacterium]